MELQNNFTTLEQSKRLLELGLPANSADCYIIQDGTISTKHFGDVPNINVSWSLGRLIEIVLKCLVSLDGQIPSVKFCISDPNISLMESLIINLTNGRYEYDFSRLDLNEQ